MTKTSKAKLAANERNESKLKRKNVIFNQRNDSELLGRIESDSEGFSPLVLRLLKKHYDIA